jgi:hypothetical protein
MAQVKPNWSIPWQKEGRFDDLDHIREHQQIAWAAAGLGADMIVLGWNLTSTTRNADQFPTQRVYEEPASGYKIRITITYTGLNRDRTTYESDVGSGWEAFDPSVLDEVFDGSDLLRATEWST